MIDLHNHILPGVDDGAQSLDDSCDMARALLTQGVSTVCCTPHSTDWATAGDASRIAERVADLQLTFTERGIELQLLAGSEAHLTTTLPEDVERGRVATLNSTKYLLLEFPYDSLPPRYEEVLFDLQLRGQRLIIAHPERIAPIADDPSILLELVRRGCLGQLTAMSLTGGFGSRIRAVSEIMLEHNLVHLIASDAHDAHAGGRLFALRKARCISERLVGPERGRALFEDTPERIVAGQAVQAPPPLELKKRFSLRSVFH